MNDKTYRTEVRTDSDYEDIPSLAVFTIPEDVARKIVKLARLVKKHDLYMVERFDRRTSYFTNHLEQEPEEAAEAGEENEVRTEIDTLCVSETEFWFSACLKHTNVQISTSKQSIAELVAHFGFGPPANPAANDEVPVGTSGRLVTLDGSPIAGTYEKVPGSAGVIAATRKEDGSLEFDYDGETKMWWDESDTVKNTVGEILFVTEDGDIVPASRVKLVPEA